MIYFSDFSSSGGGGSDPSSTQWRLYFPTPNIGATDTVVLYEVEMRETNGGADECTGGTASASSNATPITNAFNNNTSDYWSSTVGSIGTDQWLQYSFGSAKTIREITLMIYDRNHSPTEIRVQYYNGTTWVTWWTITSVTDYIATEIRTFSIADSLWTVRPTISGSYATTSDVATVSFTASAGTASYQWYRDGVAIGGATSSSYTRTDSDNILLSCAVTLTLGSIVGSYTAHVFAPNGGAFVGRVYDFTQVALLMQNSDGTGAVSADGDPIAWVKDIGGAGNLRVARHLTQSVNTSRRPLWRSSAGINSAEFDGSNDYFAMPSLEYFTEGHMVWSWKRDLDPPTTDTNAGPPIGQSGSSTSSDHHPYSDGNIYQGFMSTTRRNIGNPSTAMTSWHYQDMWSATNDWGLAISGTNFYTTATNTVGRSDVPMIGSHQRNRGDAGTYYDGRMGRIALSPAKLTGNLLSSSRSWVQEAY